MYIGICVKSRDKKWYFDYEIDAKSTQLKDSELNTWRTLSSSEISGDDHFRCLWLSRSSTDGPSILDTITGTKATVVIVINTIDSFQVEDWVTDCCLPVIVLCSSSGRVLQTIFEKSFDNEVTATISRISMTVEKDTNCKHFCFFMTSDIVYYMSI